MLESVISVFLVFLVSLKLEFELFLRIRVPNDRENNSCGFAFWWLWNFTPWRHQVVLRCGCMQAWRHRRTVRWEWKTRQRCIWRRITSIITTRVHRKIRHAAIAWTHRPPPWSWTASRTVDHRHSSSACDGTIIRWACKLRKIKAYFRLLYYSSACVRKLIFLANQCTIRIPTPIFFFISLSREFCTVQRRRIHKLKFLVSPAMAWQNYWLRKRRKTHEKKVERVRRSRWEWFFLEGQQKRLEKSKKLSAATKKSRKRADRETKHFWLFSKNKRKIIKLVLGKRTTRWDCPIVSVHTYVHIFFLLHSWYCARSRTRWWFFNFVLFARLGPSLTHHRSINLYWH